MSRIIVILCFFKKSGDILHELEEYIITPYKVSIKKNKKNQYYHVSPIIDTKKYHTLANLLKKKLIRDSDFLQSRIHPLKNLLIYLQKYIHNELTILPSESISENFISIASEWIAYKILNLDKIMPLLLDDKIQEIYLDNPDSFLYLDHQNFGRCITNITLALDDLESFITRIKLERDALLNHLNPSLKAEIETNRFHIRTSIDIKPLAADGISLNIRKLRKKIWTLPELIFNNMLDIDVASYLLYIMLKRNNITIIGEPGSGKTTLANAFDFLTPQYWRKISIEDVIESIEQTQFSKFQTRYVVSPFESSNEISSKSTEIIKLLHRTPTWVFLGEIQTKEHSQALFEALSCGLVGIQTCHGRSVEQMLIRWLNHHQIPIGSISSLDILIELSLSMKKWEIKRRVNRVIEVISPKNSFIQNGKIFAMKNNLFESFRFDTTKSIFIPAKNLFDSPTMKKIRLKENITEKDFLKELELIRKTLNFLVSKKIFNPKKVLLVFDRLLNQQRTPQKIMS